MSAVIGQARADAATEVRRLAGIATDMLLDLAAMATFQAGDIHLDDDEDGRAEAAADAADATRAAAMQLSLLRIVSAADIDAAHGAAREAITRVTGLSVAVGLLAEGDLDARQRGRDIAGGISEALGAVMVAVGRLETE